MNDSVVLLGVAGKMCVNRVKDITKQWKHQGLTFFNLNCLYLDDIFNIYSVKGVMAIIC